MFMYIFLLNWSWNKFHFLSLYFVCICITLFTIYTSYY